MSRTKRDHSPNIYLHKRIGRDGESGMNKGCGYEYWSGRPYSGYTPGHENKVLCNRIERRSYKPKEIQIAVEAEGI